MTEKTESRVSVWVAAGLLVALAAMAIPAGGAAAERFEAALYEDVPADWEHAMQTPALAWRTPHLGVGAVPGKLSPAGFTMQRSAPFAVRVSGRVQLPRGQYEFRLRSVMKARFYLDDRLVLATEVPRKRSLTAEEIAAQEAADKKAREEAAQQQAEREAREAAVLARLEDPALKADEENLKAVQAELDKVRAAEEERSDTQPPPEIQTVSAAMPLETGAYAMRLELTGPALARDVAVLYRRAGEPWALLSLGEPPRFTERAWEEWRSQEARRVGEAVERARQPLMAAWERHWRARHESLARQAADTRKHPLTARPVDRFLDASLEAAGVEAAPPSADHEFVRRVYLDTWGVVPTAKEVRAFLADTAPDRRNRLIDRLLADERWAAPWTAYWEDVLAENPVIYGLVPNSTGAFKNWVYRSFAEHRGYDRFATELILMEGTDKEAGTLGFRESVGNDLPSAEKAFVISQAFMAANMKCARCHDSPVNTFRQRDLLGIAALLDGQPVVVPETSSVGEVPGRRKPAVPVTTKPGDAIEPHFVFDPARDAAALSGDGRRYREALADWLVSHRRFAEVGVNRIWKRFMGRGLVEPVDNWPRSAKVSHPELLEFLVEEFQASGFQVRRVQELILKSDAYQRRRDHRLASAKDASGRHLFAAQPVRRMSAEEVVDSLHQVVGREFRTEKQAYASVDYGFPKRTWQLVTLSNEEDNAILVRPLLQEILTTAGAFGWRDQRPDPVSVRSEEPNALQSLTMANGALVNRLVRLTDSNSFTGLAAGETGFDEFCEQLMLATLSRPPTPWEIEWLSRRLSPVWEGRRSAAASLQPTASPESQSVNVKYKDMLDAYRYIAEARQGEPATRLLEEGFRKELEHVLWVILNSPEFLFVP